MPKLSKTQLRILIEINKNIERGDRKIIVHASGKSITTVSNTLNINLNTYDTDVIECAVNLMLNKQQDRKKMLHLATSEER